MAKRRSTDIPVSRTTPSFLAEHVITNEHTLINGGRVDDAQFGYEGDQIVTVGGAAAPAAGATTLTVTALAKPLKSGTVLLFEGNIYVTLTADAAAGATTLAVQPLPAGLALGAAATVRGTGRKFIPGGTLLGRTDAETFWGPWAAGDTEAYLSIYDIEDAMTDDDVALLLGGFQIYHQRLPGWAALPQAQKDLIRGKYVCLRGLTQ